MADPAVVNLNEWVWTKIATAVTGGNLNRLSSTVSYYQTYRLTGTAAPTAPTVGTLPEEAVKIFEKSNQEPIESTESIDVYILCKKTDEIIGVYGKLRVDI